MLGNLSFIRMANYDIIGNIAILKTDGKSKKEVIKQAKKLLVRPNIETVVEKAERFKGRLRTIKTKHLLGKKTLVTEHKENACLFRMNIETCYFSPRLSNDRLEVAKTIKKKDRVLCLFSGVAPYPIVIAKSLLKKNSREEPKKIIAIELGKECNKYAKQNIKLNKLEGKIELIQGDVKKVIPKLVKKKEKFDVIVMTRPNLKYSFLKEALSVAKKGTKIIYHGFCKQNKLKELIDDLKKEAKGKIKVLKKKEIGDIAPYKYRYRIEMKVL